MSNDLIRYDLLVQDAMREVVRKVLTDAAREGLPGEHHFCIAFRTVAPGVKLSSRMREKFPDEMTIILQHQFWDLIVTEQGFEVGLSFSNVPEKLVIPFDAITGFFDPSVQFGLKFEVELAPETGANDSEPVPLPVPAAPAKLPAKVPAATAAESEKRPHTVPPTKLRGDKPAKAEVKPEPVPEVSEKASDKVVSIDAFRKKT